MARSKQPKPVHQLTAAQFEAMFPNEEACEAYVDFGIQPPPRLAAVAQHADEKEGNCNHAMIML